MSSTNNYEFYIVPNTRCYYKIDNNYYIIVSGLTAKIDPDSLEMHPSKKITADEFLKYYTTDFWSTKETLYTVKLIIKDYYSRYIFMDLDL